MVQTAADFFSRQTRSGSSSEEERKGSFTQHLIQSWDGDSKAEWKKSGKSHGKITTGVMFEWQHRRHLQMTHKHQFEQLITKMEKEEKWKMSRDWWSSSSYWAISSLSNCCLLGRCCRYQAKRLEGTVGILFPLQHPWYPKSPPQLSLISWSNILADKHFLCSVAQLQRCRVFSRLCQQLLVSSAHWAHTRSAQGKLSLVSMFCQSW